MRRRLALSAGPLILLCLATGNVAAVRSGQQPLAGAASPQSDSSPRALVNQYCVGCHNERSKVGGLALDSLDIEKVAENAEVWEKVVRRVRARAMPPAGRSRPSETA